MRTIACESVLQLITRRRSSTYSVGRNVLKLKERGLLKAVLPRESDQYAEKRLVESPQTVYCGFDPTADSLHIGNLVPLVAALHCLRGGHNAIFLVGSATAQIGDPSGKLSDRTAISQDNLHRNTKAILTQIERIAANHEQLLVPSELRAKSGRFQVLQNSDFYADRNVVDFCVSVVKRLRIKKLLELEHVRVRLDTQAGMNLSEFLYPVFQAFDWLTLLQRYGCRFQIGGNDQTGNIDFGIDFCWRVAREQTYGLTTELLTDAQNVKIGKTDNEPSQSSQEDSTKVKSNKDPSSTGAQRRNDKVWLDSAKSSPFELYQYFLRRPDTEVERYLRIFSFLPENEIQNLMRKHLAHKESWHAQKCVAESVTQLVHGDRGLEEARLCTDLLFKDKVENLAKLTDLQLIALFHAAVTHLVFDPELTLKELCMRCNAFRNAAECEKIIREGGVRINLRQCRDPSIRLTKNEHMLPNGITLLKFGKHRFHLVKWS